MKQIFKLNTAFLKTPNGGTGWPAGYSLRGGVDLGTTSAGGRKELGYESGTSGLQIQRANHRPRLPHSSRRRLVLFVRNSMLTKILFVILF